MLIRKLPIRPLPGLLLSGLTPLLSVLEILIILIVILLVVRFIGVIPLLVWPLLRNGLIFLNYLKAVLIELLLWLVLLLVGVILFLMVILLVLELLFRSLLPILRVFLIGEDYIALEVFLL